MTTGRSHPAPPATVQHRGASTLLGLVVPLGILAASTLVASSWRDDLPAQVAIHWGPDGPDGFSTLTTLLVICAATTVPVVVALWVIAVWKGQARPARQFSAGLSVGLMTFVAGITVGTLAPQRGLADGADVGGVDWAVALAVVVSVALGLGAAALTPRGVPTPGADEPRGDAPRIALTDAERAVWVRRTSSSTGILVLSVATALVTVAVVVGNSWWLLVVPAVLVLLTLAMFSWVVTVDSTGLTVRSTLGLPRRHLPIDEVVDATVDTVSPLRDFGGYGWRTSTDGRTGVVIRAGETLEVRSTGERRFVVTVDDASTAAALLNSLADRARAASRG
jgi:hypothetical protein